MGDEIIAKASTHGFQVERNTYSVSYFVTGVPRHLKRHSCTTPSQSLLPQEVESSAGQKAVYIAISKRDDGTSPLTSYIISFVIKPRYGFRIFNSDPARELKYKPGSRNGSDTRGFTTLETTSADLSAGLAEVAHRHELTILGGTILRQLRRPVPLITLTPPLIINK